ncbi:MAG: sulfatase-like hydrolase/transferase, partial [Actinomycetota bacterium]|nr:sulfatase-like hydrolase/transferase [Actinomycetota bacterium]
LVVAITTTAYQYFEATGSTLDWSVIIFYLGTLGEVKNIIASEAPWYVWVVLVAALMYVLLGPWFVARITVRRRTRLAERTAGISRLGAVGLCLISVGLGSLSLMPGTADANQSFSLSPFINVLVTGIGGPEAEELQTETVSLRAANSLRQVRLEETPQTERRNVVLIHLESARERSITPYNKNINTTPFLNELAEHSLLVERAYTTTPHTSKAITSLNCGIYPHPETDIIEAEPGAIPVRCLPELLGEQGYKSVFFQSATETFEDRPQLVENFGYDDFYGLEDMNKKGFERAGYLGYEDDIMLEPSRKWLEENGHDGPFLASYVTITSHHEWLEPDRYGLRDFHVKDDRLNRYLNTLRYLDFFVKALMDQYKELGLYDDTIFIIYGDHGEGFAEHGVRGHDNVIHEEGLRVPLIIHDPQHPEAERLGADVAVNHMDIPPTILDMLNYKLVGGRYPGTSIFAPPPEDRTLYFSCRPDLLCMASIKGYSKYIYYYGKQPDELYDLEEDPLERHNLADKVPPKELKKRRVELLEWRSKAAAAFDEAPPQRE